MSLLSRKRYKLVPLLQHSANDIPRSGLYIPNTEAYPVHFRGMGIRIEDSVCVQEVHPLVLTTEAVKEVDDIEALRN